MCTTDDRMMGGLTGITKMRYPQVVGTIQANILNIVDNKPKAIYIPKTHNNMFVWLFQWSCMDVRVGL